MLSFDKFAAQLGEDRPLPESISRGTDAFRFAMRPPYGEHSVIRVEFSSGDRCVRLAAHFSPATRGEEVLTVRMDLDAGHWNYLRSLVDFVEFWSLPEERPTYVVLDGTTMEVQGCLGGRFHRVQRCSPRGGQAGEYFCLLCNYFVALGEAAMETVE